jgi:hypothetical protein
MLHWALLHPGGSVHAPHHLSWRKDQLSGEELALGPNQVEVWARGGLGGVL